MISMKDFFDFKEQPFRMVAISENFFESKNFSNATESFIQYLSSDMPFFQIIGSNGTGKSSFIKKAVSLLDRSYICSIISYRGISSFELLLKLADDFNIEYGNNIDEYRLFHLLLNYINSLAPRRERAIIFIDDADTISARTLETLISFVDLTSPHDNLKVVLLGNYNLEKLTGSDKLISLSQRTFANAKLTNLSQQNIRKFIKTQIKNSGSKNLAISNNVIQKVAKLSKGNMRIINLLLEKSMIAAYLDDQYTITLKHFNKALVTTNTIRTYLNSFLNDKRSAFYKIAFLVLMLIFSIDIVFNHIVSDDIKSNVKNILTINDKNSEDIKNKKSASFAKNLFINNEAIQLVEADNNSTKTDIGVEVKQAKPEVISVKPDAKPVKQKTPQVASNQPKDDEKDIDIILTINATSLNMRSKPSTNSSIIASLKSGEQVRLVRDDGAWIYVKYRNMNGYVMKQYTTTNIE